MKAWLHSPAGVALALALAAGVGYATLRQPEPGAPSSAPRAAEQGAAPSSGQSPVSDLRLESLDRQRESFSADGRNLFRFEEAAPSLPMPRAPAPRPPQGPPPPPPPPPLPPIALKFIGVLESAGQGGRVAILSDSRGNVFHGKEGDIIDGRYRVLRIGADSAELAHLDGRGRQMLRLSGQ